MKVTTIELFHPDVNDGMEVSMIVFMTPIFCSPPNHLGRSRMGDIDILVPIKSEERRWLHKFKDAISGPSGTIPIRLTVGEHVGHWAVRTHTIEGENMRYSLFYSKP